MSSSLRRKSKLAAAMISWLALVASCGGPVEQPVSGPVTLGPEWSEVAPPSPLRVVKEEQAVRLQLAGIQDMDLDDSLKLDDGRSVSIAAEVVDNEGAVYSLSLGGVTGRRHAFLYRAGEYPPGPDFPVDRTIVKLRLRSDARLEVEDIRWICSTTH